MRTRRAPEGARALFFLHSPPDAMDNFTVLIDGEEVQIGTDQIQEEGVQVLGPGEAPDGFVDKDVAEENKRRAVQQATEGLISVEEAAENSEVVEAVLEQHQTGKDLDPDDIRETVREKEVQPLQERLGTLEEGLVEQALTNAAQSLGVKKEFLRGRTPYILHEFGDQLEFDPERGQVVATDEDGNLMAGEDGVAGPVDLLREKKDQDEYSHLFGEPMPQGSGGSHDPSTNGSTSGGNRRFTRSEVKEMSPEEYAEHKEAIHEQMNRDGGLPEG